MKTKEEILSVLGGFCGTNDYHRLCALSRATLFTDGAAFVAQSCEAFWLMDKIAYCEARIMCEPFQVWTLKVKDREAVLTCDDGNGNILHKEKIEYTDFPLESIKFYKELGSIDGRTQCFIVMLPSER